MLSGDMKLSRINVNGHLLTRYSANSDDFHIWVVTYDEILLYHYDPESKQELMEWKQDWEVQNHQEATIFGQQRRGTHRLSVPWSHSEWRILPWCANPSRRNAAAKIRWRICFFRTVFFLESWLGNHDVEVLIIGYQWLENWKEQVRVLEGKLKSKYPALSVWGTFWYPSHNGYILILAGMSVSSIIIMGSSVNLQLCPYFHNISGK